MILSDVLGSSVIDPEGQRLGFATDARFVLRSPAGSDLPSEARLEGLIVSPRTRSAFLGYDRADVESPALIARYLKWRHRGSFMVLWEDIERIAEGNIELRSGYRRYRLG
jgi:hypothetical protein